jgi:hypothetical protein
MQIFFKYFETVICFGAIDLLHTVIFKLGANDKTKN